MTEQRLSNESADIVIHELIAVGAQLERAAIATTALAERVLSLDDISRRLVRAWDELDGALSVSPELVTLIDALREHVDPSEPDQGEKP